MAIFSDLPIELLHRIIELSVEDAIAVNNDRLRRQILLKLSLVSKEFTLPSQVTLWKNIRVFNHASTRALLVNEIAVGKIVEELKLFLHHEHFSELDLSNLKIFLNRLKRVDSLVLYTSELSSSLIKFVELLEIPSLKELKVLSITGYPSIDDNFFSNISCDFRRPSLQQLTIFNFTLKNDDFFSKIIAASSNTLTSLRLTRTEFKSFFSCRTFDSIKRYASRLKTLRITDCGDQLPLDLFPLCVSLKSLALNSNNSFDIPISALNLLPPSSQVECLSISIECLLDSLGDGVARSLVGNEDFDSFITTLDLPQFKELKYLYLDLLCDPAHNTWKEAVKFVRERVDFIEKVEERGIKLTFRKEEKAKIWEEKEKQRLYQERQMKLDKDLKC